MKINRRNNVYVPKMRIRFRIGPGARALGFWKPINSSPKESTSWKATQELSLKHNPKSRRGPWSPDHYVPISRQHASRFGDQATNALTTYLHN